MTGPKIPSSVATRESRYSAGGVALPSSPLETAASPSRDTYPLGTSAADRGRTKAYIGNLDLEEDDDGRLQRASAGQDTAMAKVESAGQLGTIITESIDAIVQKAGVSREEAARAVSFSAPVLERVRLKREIISKAQDVADMRDLHANLNFSKAVSDDDAEHAGTLDGMVSDHMRDCSVCKNRGDGYSHVLATSKSARAVLAKDKARHIGAVAHPLPDDDGVGKFEGSAPRNPASRQTPSTAPDVEHPDEVPETADILARIGKGLMRCDDSRAAALMKNSALISRVHRTEKNRRPAATQYIGQARGALRPRVFLPARPPAPRNGAVHGGAGAQTPPSDSHPRRHFAAPVRPDSRAGPGPRRTAPSWAARLIITLPPGSATCSSRRCRTAADGTSASAPSSSPCQRCSICSSSRWSCCPSTSGST